jgi:hypothetical protein
MRGRVLRCSLLAQVCSPFTGACVVSSTEKPNGSMVRTSMWRTILPLSARKGAERWVRGALGGGSSAAIGSTKMPL